MIKLFQPSFMARFLLGGGGGGVNGHQNKMDNTNNKPSVRNEMNRALGHLCAHIG